MDKKPKGIWRKNITGRLALVIWLAIAAFVVMACGLIIGLTDFNRPINSLFFAGVVIIGVALGVILILIYIILPLLRFLFWKHWRRTLFGLACFITLIALLYAEEDWRGRHDWEKFKRKWEAKGEHFDWQSIVPPPVPDDQNFALTPIVASSYETYFDKNGKDLRPRNTNVVDRMAMLSWRDNPWTNSPNSYDGVWIMSKFVDLKPWQNYFRSTPPPDSIWARTNKNSFFPTALQPQSPAADVLLALSKCNSAIEELREAGKLPYSRFPLEYDGMPAGIMLPHLADLKQCSKALQLRAIAELQSGESEKALSDVKLILRLQDSIHTEPFLISHLVRDSMVQTALQPIYEGLANHQWADEQLVDLDSELAKLDFLADCKFAIRGERGLEIANIEFFRHPHDFDLGLNRPRFYFLAPLFYLLNEFSGFSDGDNLGKFQLLALSFGPSGWLYQNELRVAQFDTKWYLPIVDEEQKTISPKLVSAANNVLMQEVKHQTPENVLEALFVPGLGSSATRFAYVQTGVNLARTAIALERYRLAHGNYPDSLEVLAPQFISAVPHDVIGGGTLHYRRTDDQPSQSSGAASGNFVLYSVGWNETDDGGVVGFTVNGNGTTNKNVVDNRRGDWVWRYPAK